MLRNLRIRNYAIVDELGVEFQPGLNIITGATGAGKSIIVGAVNLILGERAQSDVVRTGFETAEIEAVFNLPDDRSMKNLVSELGISLPDNALIIRREISNKGQGKCYVNDRLVTLASLKAIGDQLADLHGQHEHQSLLNAKRHIEYLDHYGDLDEVVSRVSETYHSIRRKQKDLEDLQNIKNLDEERRKLYDFQIREIEKANLSPDEEEKLSGERGVLENIEALFELSSNLYQELYESEASILQRITSLSKELKRGTQLDSRLKETDENLESCMVRLRDISRFMEGYKGRLEFDPERLETIRERLNLLSSLKRKYAKSVEELLVYKEHINKELERIENKDEIIHRLEKDINEHTQRLHQECCLLSQKRKIKASEFSKNIQKALAGLGMDKTRFEIRVNQGEDKNGLVELGGKRFLVSEKGMDQVEFFVSPNPGEERKPLAKIASGGEISRIMLALKSILAKTDRVESMIFDEIDVGIGGEVASAVGKSLKNLASSHQVIVITHLQQIASQADHHLKAFKENLKGRTVTRIKRLDKEERVKEIARMISGEEVSQLTLKQAEEMIKATYNPPSN